MKRPPTPPTLSEPEVEAKLRRLGETALLSHRNLLSPEEKETLYRHLAQINEPLLAKQRALLHLTRPPLAPSYAPLSAYEVKGNSSDQQRGRELVQKGKGACVILSGGQGSRLRCNGPKGCIPITPFTQKTLFQLVAEKVKAASLQTGYPLRIAFMTSPLNHEETKRYFTSHAYFGLTREQVSFFPQELWPFLDDAGHLFLESSTTLAQGPNGNGSLLQQLVTHGIAEAWHKEGVDWIQVIPIDNPLALPFDYEFFGLHARTRSELVVKTTTRRNSQEKVGVFVVKEGKLGVVEYSEREEALTHSSYLANIGLYGFSMAFLQRVAELPLPLHCAQKSTFRWSGEGAPQRTLAWKFEEFIFDLFPAAHSYAALLVPREREFAPLKNLSGEDSIESVQAALLAANREVYADVSGCRPDPTARFELSASFYYPTESLRARWAGRPPPQQGYLD